MCMRHESCHTYITHTSHIHMKWAVSHWHITRTSHMHHTYITHTYEWVVRHVVHVHEAWVLSHIFMSHGSCHTYASVVSCHMCVTWRIHTYDMTHWYLCHDTFICVAWPIYMCDTTHSYVWHDSFIRVTWLILCVLCMHVCMYVCLHICMYACRCICTYVRNEWRNTQKCTNTYSNSCLQTPPLHTWAYTQYLCAFSKTFSSDCLPLTHTLFLSHSQSHSLSLFRSRSIVRSLALSSAYTNTNIHILFSDYLPHTHALSFSLFLPLSISVSVSRSSSRSLARSLASSLFVAHTHKPTSISFSPHPPFF